MFDKNSNSAFNSLVSRYKRNKHCDMTMHHKYEKECGAAQFPYNFSQVYKKDIRVCGAILRIRGDETNDGNTKYAIVKGRYTGKWSFPKGKAHPEETPIKCAIRELKEETGIDVDVEPSDSVQLSFGTYYIFDIDKEYEFNPSDTHEIMYGRWVTLKEMDIMNLNADANEYKRALFSAQK